MHQCMCTMTSCISVSLCMCECMCVYECVCINVYVWPHASVLYACPHATMWLCEWVCGSEWGQYICALCKYMQTLACMNVCVCLKVWLCGWKKLRLYEYMNEHVRICVYIWCACACGVHKLTLTISSITLHLPAYWPCSPARLSVSKPQQPCLCSPPCWGHTAQGHASLYTGYWAPNSGLHTWERHLSHLCSPVH